MKARTAIILWVVSVFVLPLFGWIGALFKIQHWPLSWAWDLVAWLFSAVMALVVAMKVMRYPGFKDFLDR